MRPTICLPTYNERQNIEPMLRALAPYSANVLVIDNNSPDGTGRLAGQLTTKLCVDRTSLARSTASTAYAEHR